LSRQPCTASGLAGATPGLCRLGAPERREHWHLEPHDRCLFLAHYRAGKAGASGDGARLMHNFKCAPSLARHDPRRAHYKRLAIETLAGWLRAAVPRGQAEGCTWVPVPCSRCRDDADFDERLVCTLRRAFRGYDIDVRALLYQACSTRSDHVAGVRLASRSLERLLRLDTALLNARPVRSRLVLFDDVLTSGKHYKCCQRRLAQALPGTPVVGVFLMRRRLSPPARR
jgi:hypothetical protein